MLLERGTCKPSAGKVDNGWRARRLATRKTPSLLRLIDLQGQAFERIGGNETVRTNSRLPCWNRPADLASETPRPGAGRHAPWQGGRRPQLLVSAWSMLLLGRA